MTNPIVVTAVFFPAPGQHDAVVAAISPAIAAVHAEPGCLLYALHNAQDGSIVMVEKWESAELLDAHGAGDAVANLTASLAGMLERPVDVTRLVPIPAGTAEQGQL
ncbi:putative quinol monooxygenase [Marisediminicola antarctica]|uniref:Antibiotic biosynthesis monooxygenase n=1 Tax=Marisediminicola antarctica TaxID=674079 RepID=A0A7L5AFR7_9MICO|nr:putative quinol monooxygenase [Marisediminicola antarctica]QHO69323.1 antibiotic biosynthesis monooxygenase [Marisediminicola antarctica]